MIYKTKIAMLFFCIIILSAAFQSVLANCIISDVDFVKKSDGKTEIKVIANAKFEYMVNPANKILEIEFSKASFSDSLIEKLEGLKNINSDIEQVYLENLENGSSKLKVKLLNPATFKFVINASNALAKLYAIDKNSNLKTIKVKSGANQNNNKTSDRIANSDNKIGSDPVNSTDNKINESNPIPDDELLRRLDDDSTPEIPRLTLKNTFETSPQSEQENYENIDVQKMNKNSSQQMSAKSNIPLSNNAQRIISNKNLSSKVASKPKIIEINRKDKVMANMEPTEPKLLYQPREINSLTLGLFEQIDNNAAIPLLTEDEPRPKSSLTSDGKLAFTVYSANGSYNGVIQKSNITSIPAYGNNQNKSSDNIQNLSRPKYKINKGFKILILKAKEYQTNGDSDMAESYYQKAIENSPDVPWGYVSLAEFYDSEKDYSNAIISYNNALKLLPNKIELIYNIAVDFYKLADFQKSEAYLEKVVDISPSFTLGYYNLGTLAYKRGDFEDSIKYLNKSLELNPVLNDAHYNIALAYLGKNEKTQALAHFKKCLDIDPYDTECSQMYSKFSSQKK